MGDASSVFPSRRRGQAKSNRNALEPLGFLLQLVLWSWRRGAWDPRRIASVRREVASSRWRNFAYNYAFFVERRSFKFRQSGDRCWGTEPWNCGRKGRKSDKMGRMGRARIIMYTNHNCRWVHELLEVLQQSEYHSGPHKFCHRMLQAYLR